MNSFSKKTRTNKETDSHLLVQLEVVTAQPAVASLETARSVVSNDKR